MARGGDEGAFAELVRETSRIVFGAARRIVGDASLAEDIAQETYFRAWRNLPRLERPAAFGGWIRTMAVRRALDHVRSNRKLAFFPDGPPDRPSTDNPERRAVDVDRRRMVMEEVARMPAEFAETVVMVDLEGLTYEEAAATIGISLENLKVRLHRARKQLREQFAARGIVKVEDA